MLSISVFAGSANVPFKSSKELYGVWMKPHTLEYIEITSKGIASYARTKDSFTFKKGVTKSLKELKLSADKTEYSITFYAGTNYECTMTFTKDSTGTLYLAEDRGDDDFSKLKKFADAKSAVAYAKSGKAKQELLASTPEGVYMRVAVSNYYLHPNTNDTANVELELYDASEKLLAKAQLSKENYNPQGPHYLVKFNTMPKEGTYHILLKKQSPNVTGFVLNNQWDLKENQHGMVKLEVVDSPYALFGTEAWPIVCSMSLQ